MKRYCIAGIVSALLPLLPCAHGEEFSTAASWTNPMYGWEVFVPAAGCSIVQAGEDEIGTTESMSRAANWVQQNLDSRASLGAPEVTTGQVLLNATR